MANIQVDVAIIGAGLIGSTMAIALTAAGMRVALIDHTDLHAHLTAHYDGRTLAIAYGSKLILEQWQIWHLIADYATPINHIHISSPKPGCYMNYNGHQVADHPMGYIVDIQHLRQSLFNMLRKDNRCQLIMPQTFHHIEQTSTAAIIHLNNNQCVQAQIVIGADGRKSSVRQAIGIQPWIWDYQQTSIVGVIKHARPHNNMAFEHFTPDGPLALLPMPDNCASLVWTLPCAKAKAFMNYNVEIFNEELQRCFGAQLGELKIVGKRWAYDLQGLYCPRWYQGRVSLIGDACHVIHPVAGQGFNLGLRDANVLVDKLSAYHNKQGDLGSEALLRSYQRARRVDTVSMTAMTDGLVRLFTNDSLLLNSLRNTGLKITQRLPLIKNMLTRHAMGLKFNSKRI